MATESDLRCGPRHFSVGSAVMPGKNVRLYIYGPGSEKARGDFEWHDVRDVVGNASRRLALEMWKMVDRAIEASLDSGHPTESIRAEREALWRQCFVTYVLTAARNGGVEGASRDTLRTITRLVNICPECGLPLRTPLKPDTNYQCPNCNNEFHVLQTEDGQEMVMHVDGQPTVEAPAAYVVR